MKRILAVLLAVFLIIASSVSAFAGSRGHGQIEDRAAGGGQIFSLSGLSGGGGATMPGGFSGAMFGGMNHGTFGDLGVSMFGANYSKARVLYDIGLFRGRSAAQFDPDLKNGATRAEAIVLIGRALGWTVDAGIKTISGYNDIPEYAAPYIQYALDHNITKGVGHNRFGSNMPVSSRMVYTWYARALLFSEDVWKDPSQLAKIGLITQEQAARLTAIDDAATRDLIVGILFDSLQWKMRGSNMRLIQRLVNELWVSRDAAEDAGLLNPASKLVFSAKALSGKAIQLDFNLALETATILPAHFEIAIGSPAVPTAAYTLSLSGTKTLLVTLDNLLPAGTSVTVKPLAGLKSVSGLATDGSSKTIRMIGDTTAPRVTQAVAVSNTGIKLTFSEPISSTATEVATHVYLDGQLLAGAPAFASGNQEWTLTLPAGAVLAAGSHALVVTAGIRDVSGLESAAYSKTVTVAAERVPPSVLEVSVLDRTHLHIRFSESVKPGVGTLAIGTRSYPVPGALQLDGTLAALTLDTPLPDSADTLPMLLRYAGIEDLIGNKVGEEMHVSFTAPQDQTAPAATQVALQENVIVITFSEPIDGFDATDFTLTGVDGSGASFTPVVTGTAYDAATRIARITLDANAFPEGATTLTLVLTAGIKDLSVNENRSVEASYTLTHAKDTTSPKATVTTEAAFTIVVTFDEAVDGFSTDDFDLTGINASGAAIDLSGGLVTATYDNAARMGRIVIAEGALAGETGTVSLTLKLLSGIHDLAAVPNVMAPATHLLLFNVP